MVRQDKVRHENQVKRMLGRRAESGSHEESLARLERSDMGSS